MESKEGVTVTVEDGLTVVYKGCQYMKYVLNAKGFAIEGWGYRRDTLQEAYQYVFSYIFKDQELPKEDGVKDGWKYVTYDNLYKMLQQSPQDCFEVLTNFSDNEERNKELADKRELIAIAIQYEHGEPVYD